MNKKFLRLLSVPVAIVFLVSTFGVSFCVSGANVDATNFSASKEMVVNSSNNEKSTWNKIKDNIKENAILYTAGAAATIAVASLIAYNVLPEEHHDIREVINDFSSLNMVSVPADYWFEKLGGTQQDIENYMRNDNVVANDQIGKDVNRCAGFFMPIYPKFLQVFNLKELEKVFYNMLKKYYTEHEKVEYIQGWDYILYMIYCKFMMTRGKTEALELKDEAKVYFIYTKFIEMIRLAFNNISESEWQSQSEIYANDFLNSGVGVTPRCRKNLTDKTDPYFNRMTLFHQGIVTAGVGLLGIEPAIRIWDYIIMHGGYITNYMGGCHFPRRKTLKAANALICSYVNLNSNEFFVKVDGSNSLALKNFLVQRAEKRIN